MTKKKPDIFLGITMGMTVLAVLLLLVILIVQKSSGNKKSGVPSGQTVLDSTEAPAPSDETDDPSAPSETTTPVVVDLKPIDEKSLKAELDDNIEPLSSQWDIVVVDPVVGTRITANHLVGSDKWMEANKMLPVFIMATAYQKVADGTLKEDDIANDIKAMIVEGDTEAADRLTALIGGGDAAAGMSAVKGFASNNGMTISYNRALSATSGKPNYYMASIGADVLAKLCRGELVSKEASAKMREILCTKRTTEPFDTGLKSAVSYGFITDIEDKLCGCTMGIVNTPTRSFVISIACYDPKTMENVLARFTQIIGLTEPYFTQTQTETPDISTTEPTEVETEVSPA